MLAPELEPGSDAWRAPGNVDELGVYGFTCVDGDEVPGARPAPVLVTGPGLPGRGVGFEGARGVSVPGAVPGVAVLGVVAGVSVAGGVGGVSVLGAIPGVAVVLGVPGGPASVCPGAASAGGMRVLLDESAGVGAAGVSTVSVGWCGADDGGVRSLWSTAFGPNGLRESIPLCASSVADQLVQSGCSNPACAVRVSACLTSAGVARSIVCASLTTTG